MVFPLIVAALVFWVIQLFDLLCRDVADFESQAHKLTWFIAFMAGHIITAVWYYNWKKQFTHAAGGSVTAS